MPGKSLSFNQIITSLFPGKTPFQEGSVMKFNCLLLISLLIVGAIFIPAVSAEVLTDEGSNSDTFDLQSIGGSSPDIIKVFRIYRIQDWDGLYFVYCKSNNVGNPAVLNANPSYDMDVILKIGGDVVGSGTAHYNALYNSEGTITGVQAWLDIDNWQPAGYTGSQQVSIIPSSGTLFNGLALGGAYLYSVAPDYPIGLQSGSYLVSGIHLARSHYYWENVIDISNEFVTLTRQLDGNEYVSTLQIISDAGYLEDTSPNNVDMPYVGVGTWNVTNPYGRIYSGILGSDTPVTPTIPTTVYVQNANTGFVIAGTDLNVKNYDTSVWYNSTLEWGWDTIQLPAGNYEFYAEKSGFTQYAPGRLTVDGVDDNINLLLYPDVVAPPAGNLTLQFWVCDRDSNGIPYAELSVIGLAGEGADYDSGIIQTNNLGYATLTAPGNSTYTAYASKPGYTAGENEFGVTTVSPVHIAVMLMAGEIPTNPTPTQPGVTPTVTPTVRPTDVASGNNPIDNFRIMFLNMGFDNEYSDWLTGLFIVCLGAVIGYVLAKKFGAMCGGPIGLVTATGLGLIPIWALVLIIVIVALTYAKFIMGR